VCQRGKNDDLLLNWQNLEKYLYLFSSDGQWWSDETNSNKKVSLLKQKFRQVGKRYPIGAIVKRYDVQYKTRENYNHPKGGRCFIATHGG